MDSGRNNNTRMLQQFVRNSILKSRIQARKPSKVGTFPTVEGFVATTFQRFIDLTFQWLLEDKTQPPRDELGRLELSTQLTRIFLAQQIYRTQSRTAVCSGPQNVLGSDFGGEMATYHVLTLQNHIGMSSELQTYSSHAEFWNCSERYLICLQQFIKRSRAKRLVAGYWQLVAGYYRT